MEKNYKLEPSAKEDIKESVVFYEEQREGLGGKFIDELNFKRRDPNQLERRIK